VFQAKKVGVIFFAAFLAFQAIAGSATAATLYVDDNGPGNYTTIQSALKNAVSRDTILVKPGTYPGNIEVAVDGLTIASESGNPDNTIIQVASGSTAFNLQPGSSNTIIKGFTIKGSKSGYGINFDAASSCIIEKNKFSNLSSGVSISLWTGGNQSIFSNGFSNCDTGIAIFESMDNKLKGNKISNCDTGIQVISDALGNFIIDNNVSNCNTGLWLDGSSGSEIYNNYFSNKINLKLIEPEECTWNITRTKGQNIIGGPYIGGNFWATPAGNGFSQIHSDINGDGIAEELYNIDNQNTDHLPLVVPGKQPVNNTLSNLSNNTTKPPVPSSNTSNKTVSQPSTTSNKTVNPSDNASNLSKGASDSYYNTSTGTIYPEIPVSITSENNESSAENNSSLSDNTQSRDSEQNNGSSNDGSNSESSGSSGGSSNGGGAGGSPEPAKNVEVKELTQTFFTSGKEIKFNFTENATCVVYISFDSKKTLGKTTTIAEMLKEKSALVPELPAGEVYRSFNVWVGNEGTASSNNIENPVVCFKVEKSWLEDKSVDPASITLNRYNEKKWEQFPVNMIGEDANYLYFTANVSGYSSFAITGSITGSISGKVKSYLEQQEDSEQENSLPGSTGSSRLTGETNGNSIKDETEKSTPGFEFIFGIVSLLGVFLYRGSK
jgi:PGF-pre-PGF domain-containing protein